MKTTLALLALSTTTFAPCQTSQPPSGATPAEPSGTGPLTLIHSTPLPDIVGDFDHFAVNLKGNQLFVSAEVHHSIEVFNLKTGEHIRSAPVAKTPHTLAFDEKNNRLIVADGGDNACLFLSGKDLSLVKRVQLGAYPDAGLYDAKNRLFYVGNGGSPASSITQTSVSSMSTI